MEGEEDEAMNARQWLTWILVLGGLFSREVKGADVQGFSLQVLVADAPCPEYAARGTTYVEAIRGREYALRLTNPLPVRVAVALAVDGLNTIDARHTDARSAAKWILEPYESIEVSGWQTSSGEARRFYFTGEGSSYGGWLGQTDNLGTLEAVFFRERLPVHPPHPVMRQHDEDSRGLGGVAPKSKSAGSDGAADSLCAPGVEEYAATGIGRRVRNKVERVHVDLESGPAAIVRIRYEYRQELIRLGVLPCGWHQLDRRERGHGFTGGYCPDPDPKIP
jgi:hypothetical protein